MDEDANDDPSFGKVFRLLRHFIDHLRIDHLKVEVQILQKTNLLPKRLWMRMLLISQTLLT